MKNIFFFLLFMMPIYLAGQTTDADGDGVDDLCDLCPDSISLDNRDLDLDSLANPCDNCPNDANANQLDGDSDSVGDVCDNCPNTSNASQTNSDSDGHGDACDNCPNDDNQNQANSDSDGHGDVCDNCPNDDNQDQADLDSDNIGDVCDPDKDGDGFSNETDCDPLDALIYEGASCDDGNPSTDNDVYVSCICQGECETADWDVDSIKFVQSKVLTNTNDYPKGLVFDSTGTWLFVASGISSDQKFTSYTLSTPWDASTIVYHSQKSFPNNDFLDLSIYGNSLYASSHTNNKFKKYTFGTFGDASTLTMVDSFAVPASMYGIHISSDGSQIISSENVGTKSLYRYTLSTPGNLSSSSQAGTKDLSSIGTTINSVFVKPDGTEVYLVSNNLIYTVTLSTPWDVTTATVQTNVSAPSAFGIFIKPDGRRLYFLNFTAKQINEYKIGCE